MPEKFHLIANISFKYFRPEENPYQPSKFDFEPEVTAKMLKAGLRIKEVPISYKGRGFDEGKKITWRDGFSALYTLIKYRFIKK